MQDWYKSLFAKHKRSRDPQHSNIVKPPQKVVSYDARGERLGTSCSGQDTRKEARMLLGSKSL